ncbi:MAG: class A beta-lactamase-related serine hydrolase, partial [Gemmatimonadota bacterium]|nr:class A beta-lactamase-related serine hydrolase [Gemmatimonadota bacterium]
LRIVGGPPAVTGWLRARKIAAIRVDRSEAELAFDSFGVTHRPTRSKWMVDTMRAAIRRVPPAQQERAARRFERDARDTSTPDEMTRLLDGLVRHRWISVEHSALVLRDMRVTTTTPGRLRGALPAGTESAHKSGTTATSDSGFTAGVNDVGIITLAGGQQHLAVAIFVRARAMKIENAEAVIARIGRAAYDWAP